MLGNTGRSCWPTEDVVLNLSHERTRLPGNLLRRWQRRETTGKGGERWPDVCRMPAWKKRKGSIA